MAKNRRRSTTPPGRTFRVAIGVLATLAIALVAAGGVAIVRALQLPDELPMAEGETAAGNSDADVAEQQPSPAPAVAYPEGGTAIPSLPLRQIAVVPPPELTANVDRPGRIYDPEVLELVEVGIALRHEGDTAGALRALRSADTLHPNHPRILWELAAVYNALELKEKAEAALTSLRELGALGGGEYFELAVHSLKSNLSPPAGAPSSSLAFGDVVTSPDANLEDGEQVAVRLPIHSSLGQPVSANQIDMVMQFYDLVDGRVIEETRSDPPLQSWPTAPVDWSDTGTEIVEWVYQMPVLTQEEIASVGTRRYYGFVARLYYQDKLQDVFAAPRTLLAQPRAADAPPPLLDDSLFPPLD